MATHECITLVGNSGVSYKAFSPEYKQLTDYNFSWSNAFEKDFYYDEDRRVICIENIRPFMKRCFLIQGCGEIFNVPAQYAEDPKANTAYVQRTTGLSFRATVCSYKTQDVTATSELQTWYGSTNGYDVGPPNFTDERFQYNNWENTWNSWFQLNFSGIVVVPPDGGDLTVDIKGVGILDNMIDYWEFNTRIITVLELEEVSP